MPTLFRLLVVLGLIVGAVYGAMLAMVTFLHPQPHEIVETVQLPKAQPSSTQLPVPQQPKTSVR